MSDLMRAVGRDLFEAACAEGKVAPTDRQASEPGFGAVIRRRHAHTIKAGARRYLALPGRLNTIDRGLLGLSTAQPRRALAILASLEERERATPRRHFGFGGEMPLLNIKSAKLASRWSRRFGDRLLLIAAE